MLYGLAERFIYQPVSSDCACLLVHSSKKIATSITCFALKTEISLGIVMNDMLGQKDNSAVSKQLEMLNGN